MKMLLISFHCLIIYSICTVAPVRRLSAGIYSFTHLPYTYIQLILPAMNASKFAYQELLQATVTYLEGLPTGTSVESAVANISEWEKQIRAANQSEFLPVADDLNELKKLLSGGEPKGEKIKPVLRRLSEHTTKASASADPVVSDELHKLGEWLGRVSESL